MATRTGKEYLEGLRDGRQIWMGGERIEDVTEHPDLAAGARTIAQWYDMCASKGYPLIIDDPDSGEPMNISHLIPRSPEDLALRHRGLETMARWHVGMLGRSPDYVNVSFAGFAGLSSLWAANGNEEGAARLAEFRRQVIAGDLALTHVLINPTVDKSAGEAVGANAEVALHKVADTRNGIVVSGARVLATLAPFADEITVYPGQPIPRDAQPLALAFSVPVSTPGIKMICRDSYSTKRSSFDQPFSSRFDEQDAFVIFDNVEVPLERVFLDGDTEIYNRVMTKGWVANIMQQTTIRAMVKLQFAYELVARMAAAIGANDPTTNQYLGEIWTYYELTRAALRAAEADAHYFGDGVFLCDDRPFRALRPTLPKWFPRVNEIIKTLGSHNLLAVPSAGDLSDPELKPLVEKYMAGAGSTTAKERSRLYRMAWDMVGSSLGNRTELYERFYLASSARMYQVAHFAAAQDGEFDLLDEFVSNLEASSTDLYDSDHPWTSTVESTRMTHSAAEQTSTVSSGQ